MFKAIKIGLAKLLLVVSALIFWASFAVAGSERVGVGYSATVDAARDYMERTNDLIFNLEQVLKLCIGNGACAGKVKLTQDAKSDTFELNGQKFTTESKHFGWLKSFSLYSVDDGRIRFKAVPKENEVLNLSEKDAVEGDFVKKKKYGIDYFDFEPLVTSGCSNSELGDICPWREPYSAESLYQRVLDPRGLLNEYAWFFTYMRKVNDVLTRRMEKNLPLRFDMYAPSAVPWPKDGSYEILEDEEVIEKIEVIPYRSGTQNRIKMVFRINWGSILPQDPKIPFDSNAPLAGDAELAMAHFKGRRPFWFLRGARITKESGCHFTYYGDLCPVRGVHRFTPIGPKSGWAFKRLTSENPFD